MGQNRVKAGGEVEGGIGYWLSVTWAMSLSDEDATCTDLSLWGGNQHHFSELGGGEERVEGESGNNYPVDG